MRHHCAIPGNGAFDLLYPMGDDECLGPEDILNQRRHRPRPHGAPSAAVRT